MMLAITQADLDTLLTRVRNGEDLGRRASRSETLDEHFRRRNQAMERVRRQLEQKRKGVKA
jgi:hypothetical protein